MRELGYGSTYSLSQHCMWASIELYVLGKGPPLYPVNGKLGGLYRWLYEREVPSHGQFIHMSRSFHCSDSKQILWCSEV